MPYLVADAPHAPPGAEHPSSLAQVRGQITATVGRPRPARHRSRPRSLGSRLKKRLGLLRPHSSSSTPSSAESESSDSEPDTKNHGQFIASNYVFQYRHQYENQPENLMRPVTVHVEHPVTYQPRNTPARPQFLPMTSSVYTNPWLSRIEGAWLTPSQMQVTNNKNESPPNISVPRRLVNAPHNNNTSIPKPSNPLISVLTITPDTTVAIDRPGLTVSGQRICIVTGGNPEPATCAVPPAVRQTSVVKINNEDELQTNTISLPVVIEKAQQCISVTSTENVTGLKVDANPQFAQHKLRRSFSERSHYNNPRRLFQDTTRLHENRTRPSLANVFPDRQTQSTPTTLAKPHVTRPKVPPPPPPDLCLPPTDLPPPVPSIKTEAAPPTPPPRRIFRFSKAELKLLEHKLGEDNDSKKGFETNQEADPSTREEGNPHLEILTPGITTFGGRPLSNQLVSWSSWAGVASGRHNSGLRPPVVNRNDQTPEAEPQESIYERLAIEKLGILGYRTRDENLNDSTSSTTHKVVPKRRPVSRLWPSFSTLSKPKLTVLNGSSPTDTKITSPEGDPVYEQFRDHIYEEIGERNCSRERDDAEENHEEEEDEDEKELKPGLSRLHRGSFARASKQEILQFLAELQNRSPGQSSSPVPSEILIRSPELEEDDEELASLLSALRNQALRTSHRSNTSDSSDDSVEAFISEEQWKGIAEVERTDSGVGSDTCPSYGRSRARWQTRMPSSTELLDPTVSDVQEQVCTCMDCDSSLEKENPRNSSLPLLCGRCAKRRGERKEVLAELVETEIRYGRDLRVLLEEFHRPMLVAGLLTPLQLDSIFLNAYQLWEQSVQLSTRLREAVEIALEQGDEDLLTVNAGKLFVTPDAHDMLRAFQAYCLGSGAAALQLAALEKERELLRLFLRASQLENPVVRRMSLHAFLMVPVQRVTRYPLLLNRLLKATAPTDVEGRNQLREALTSLQKQLESINAAAQDLGTRRGWKRVTAPQVPLRRNSADLDLTALRMRKLALATVKWSEEEARVVMEGKLLYTQPNELYTTRRGKGLKLHPVWAVLLSLPLDYQSASENLFKSPSFSPSEDKETSLTTRTLGTIDESAEVDPQQDSSSDLSESNFLNETGFVFSQRHNPKVKEAVLILVKDKGKPALIRDPLWLSQCLVCVDTDCNDCVEIQEPLAASNALTSPSKGRGLCILKASAGYAIEPWVAALKYHSITLGKFKQRRAALSHIFHPFASDTIVNSSI